MENYFHILCATDDNYARHCGVMICSICHNHKDNNLCFHIIENNLSDDSKSKIKSITDNYNQKLVFHRIDDNLLVGLKLEGKNYTSLSVYYRLFVTKIITDSFIEKILYLDCDIVVLKDIESLFYIDMTDYTIAAVRDINQPMYEDQSFQISFSYQDRYFNSGVILINMSNWIKYKIEDKLIEFCKRERKVYFPDQDALNKIFRGKWLELPPYWNRFNLVEYNKISFKNKRDELIYIYNPAIVHYASPTARPWMNLKFIPFSSIYNKNLSKTPWRGTRKIDVEKTGRYKVIINVKLSNFIYRSPLLIRIILTSIFDIMLVVFHLLKHKSLRYYPPYKI